MLTVEMTRDNQTERFGVRFYYDMTNTTTCELVVGEKLSGQDEAVYTVVGMGQAFCHYKDQFRRKRGRLIAFSRALDAAGISNKSHRQQLWNSLFKHVRYD